MADIGDFGEFTDGCSCGDPVAHDPDCIVSQAKFNGKPTALPDHETLSTRRSILQGMDPYSGAPLNRAGWIHAVKEAETAALRKIWDAGVRALHNVHSGFQGSGGSGGDMWKMIASRKVRCEAADRTQWTKTLMAAVRRQEALSGADLAWIRSDVVACELNWSWHTMDLVRIDNSSLALRLDLDVATMGSESLAYRKLIARWLHLACVAYPHRGDAQAVAGRPSVLVVAQARPGALTEPLPTRFIRLRDTAMLDIETGRAAMELLAGGVDFPEGDVLHWPAELMVAGSWPPLSVESGKLACLAERIRTGSVLKVEPLGSAAFVGRVHHGPPPPERAVSTHPPPGGRMLRAAVRVREPSPKFRNLNGLIDGSPKSTLLVAASVRSAAQVAAVTLPVPGIGGGWLPVIYRGYRRPGAGGPLRLAWEKSMAVWLNSALGVLSLLSAGSDPDDPHRTDEEIRWMPVPVFTKLQAESLAQVHDTHCATLMLGSAEADQDPVRLALDEAVCQVLGADAAEVSAARRLLTIESALG